MVDREFIRANPDAFRDSLRKRGEKPELLDVFLAAEKTWKELTQKIEPLRAERNTLSRGGKPKPTALKRAKELSQAIALLEEKLRKSEASLRAAHLALPNTVADDVPVGAGESANQTIRSVGEPKVKKGRSHQELMERSDWVDLKTAAEFSGSRFRYLKNSGAWAHLSIMGDALKFAIRAGFTPVVPPVLTRRQTLENAGFFPAAEDDIFQVERDNLFLTGTSEQTLLALGANKIFTEAELPLRLVGFSSCFRREVGSYGKDVEGMFRQHQFDKVELVSITTPEQSAAEHDFIVSMQEKFTRRLKLPYQVVKIGSGDLGATAVKKIDIEAWFPSQERYRETHSASNCTDFQARRFNIKYRDSAGQDCVAHTLNGTLATERLLLSYIENNQRPNGTVSLPWRWRI